MGNPVRQTIQPYDKASGKRKLSDTDSDDGETQIQIVTGLVFGQLVTNTESSAYVIQDPGSNAIDYAFSLEHATIAEEQRLLSLAAMEAAQKVEAEKLAQKLAEEEHAALLATASSPMPSNLGRHRQLSRTSVC